MEYAILILLALILLVLIKILTKPNSSVSLENYGYLYDARTKNLENNTEAIVYAISELNDSIKELNSSVDDIRHVTNIIEKYRLPSKLEQKKLDDIAVDMEVWDGINKNA
ncbi:hypothetical protein [Rahnella laticis]|uniref:hypothetical protein n=1 Tax=Rahnella laticis TaxID=2787622 RepID=UPI0018A29F1F|nr:hypothetical protein [Rahnella laticis]MBF7994092.1 hypothetical protein [Rahnella laticis]